MVRFIPNTGEQRAEMLSVLGISSEEELFSDIPSSLLLQKPLNLPPARSEMEVLARLKALAGQNAHAGEKVCFLGAGIYDHFIPSVVNHVALRQEFYTSYTPYQPELSQGTLQAIFEYQTMICELTGMDVSNASMYDGSSAMAEAAFMAGAATKKNEILVSRAVHPETRRVLAAYLPLQGLNLVEFGLKGGVSDIDDLKAKIGDDTAAVLVQNPNFLGCLEDLAAIGDLAKSRKAMFVVSANPVALSILEPPAAFGADIVVGEGQALGNPMNFGGPGFGFFAVTEKHMRKIPGRVVGKTVDRDGKTCYVLTLQAREQHIRREKATSNICSNQNLCVLMASVYMSLMGKEGLREVAEQSLQKAHFARERLLASGLFKPLSEAPFFNEFALSSAKPVDKLNRVLFENGFIGGYALSRDYPEFPEGWLVAVTEKRTREEIERFADCARRVEA